MTISYVRALFATESLRSRWLWPWMSKASVIRFTHVDASTSVSAA